MEKSERRLYKCTDCGEALPLCCMKYIFKETLGKEDVIAYSRFLQFPENEATGNEESFVCANCRATRKWEREIKRQARRPPFETV